MIGKFQDHHNEQEIQILSIHSESSEWEERLRIIETEAEFFYKLLNVQFNEEFYTRINIEDATYLINQLKSLKEINVIHQKNFQEYLLKQEGLQECDDVQCENFYLKDHLVIKKTLNKHFKAFRELKFIMYNFLEINFS